MLDLAAPIAAFHGAAEARPGHGGGAAMAAVARTNIGILRDRRSAGFPVARIDALAARLHEELARCAALLDERRARGKVRRCHGDLHLGNICLFDGKLLLFDALEFSETIASVDVLYDFAFLLMDLMHRGQRNLANLALNRYLDLTGEDDGLAAMPAFLSLRAVIRGHVIATAAEHGRGSRDPASAFAEARCYVEEAAAVLRPAPARLVAIGDHGSGNRAWRSGWRPSWVAGARVAQRRAAQAPVRADPRGAAAAGSLPARSDSAGLSRAVRARRSGAEGRLCGRDRCGRAARRRASRVCRCGAGRRRAVYRALARRTGGNDAGARRSAAGRCFRCRVFFDRQPQLIRAR